MSAPPTETSVTIRRADTPDAERLAPLFEAYCRFYETHNDPAHAQQYVTDRLANREAVVFLAFANAMDAEREDATPIGFTLVYPKFSSTMLRRDWLLNDLYVEPSERRKGVARALLGAAAEFAHDTGASKVQLKTQASNTEARELYESEGWTLDEKFVTYVLKLG